MFEDIFNKEEVVVIEETGKKKRPKVFDYDKIFIANAVPIIDEAILSLNKIKLAHPELLSDTLLQLAKYYHQMIEDDKLPL